MSTRNPFRAAGLFAGASYMERAADRQLLAAIEANSRYPYVFAARQSGKSSLLFRTMKRLDEVHFRCAFVDLTDFVHTNVNYDTFLARFAKQVTRELFQQEEPVTQEPLYLADVASSWLLAAPGRIVVFIDEADRLLGLPFCEDFFAQLRSLFNKRARDPEFERLQFVLAGATQPAKLIRNPSTSPFNVGIEIQIDRLSLDQVREMVGYLATPERTVDEKVARAIFRHTAGSVYLSQLILERVWDTPLQNGEITVGHVDAVADALVSGARSDPHFFNIYKLVHQDRDILRNLLLLEAGEIIPGAARQELVLTGISDGVEPFLNPLYERVFGAQGVLGLPTEAATPGPTDQADKQLIGGRYERIRLIGTGAHSTVWEGRDHLSGRSVAVKLARSDVSFSPARAQLEVMALRLRLPGIVELYDDGVDDGQPYLVMELVSGSPFPGFPLPCTWEEIADVTVALLETLAGIHEASVLHRDLKPANLLVTKDRRIKMLDFGTAFQESMSPDRLTETVQILGTPAYMAPEQVRGSADRRSDLYAVGVILYEALSGRLPHDGASLAALFRARRQRPLPLSQAAPGVPPSVAQIVDRLLSYDPEDRPASATAVLHLLRGEPSVEAPYLGWLGPTTVLDELLRRVRAGQSVDLIGPRGAGRTRCLQVVEQMVGGARRVVWLTPSEEAFVSLSPLIGSLSEHAGLRLEQVRRLVLDEVVRALSAGAVLLADDAEKIDATSLAVLSACRGHGAIVRVFQADSAMNGSFAAGPDRGALADDRDVENAILLAPLREEHLRALFVGPERIFHLPEDAARVLHSRTGGLPARVTEEILRWVRLGLAQWSAGRLVVGREAIEALESGFIMAAPTNATEGSLPGLSETLADLLVWLNLASPHASAALIAEAASQPLFRVEAHLAMLVEGGLAARLPDDRVVPRVAIPAATRWTEERARAAHEGLARQFTIGAEGRLAHLWMRGVQSAEDRREVAVETAALARRLIDEGRLPRAVSVLEAGLRGLRDQAALMPEETERILSLLVEAAIEAATPEALDRALYSVLRYQPPTSFTEQLAQLCRAALALRVFSRQPFEAIDRVARFEDSRLERARLSVRLQAARYLQDLSVEQVVLRETAELLINCDPDAAANIANHWGRLRYRQGRFLEAAALHLEAAEKARGVQVRAYSALASAIAYMEAFAFSEARRWAQRAAELARSQRHVYHESLAEWTLRNIAYRMGDAGSPDRELVDIVALVGNKALEANTAFTEAAIAYRCGQIERALDLALRARVAFSIVGVQAAGLLAECLCVYLEDASPDGSPTDLRDRALRQTLPGVGIQALALLAMSGRLPDGDPPLATVQELLAGIPHVHWDKRLDVLSINECLAALRIPSELHSDLSGDSRDGR